MLSSMGVHSTQRRATFILTIRFQVCTISGQFRSASLSMTYEGLHTLRLGVSLGAIHDSAERYPHPDTRKAVRQINSIAKLHHLLFSGFTDLLVLVRQQPSFKQLQSSVQYIRVQSEFWGQLFFSRGKRGRDQSCYGIKSNTSYKFNGRATKSPRLYHHSYLIITDGLD